MEFDLESVYLQLQNLNTTWGNDKDELAILLSSSRSEVNIKDKVNILIEKNLRGNLGSDDLYIVVREWKRVDLAIIKKVDDKSQPEALFEFKLRHSSFIADYDITRESGYIKTFLGDKKKRKRTGEIYRKNGIQQDIEKLKSYKDKTACYVMLGGLHPMGPLSEKYKVFKNDLPETKKIMSSFKKFNSAENIEKLCNENIKRYCNDINAEYRTLRFSIGEALGIEWVILIWVIDVSSIVEERLLYSELRNELHLSQRLY